LLLAVGLGAAIPLVQAHAQVLTTTSSDARKIGKDDVWIAALGDSFASGEGNPNVLGAPLNDWKWLDDEQCHRSTHAWPYLVAKELGPRVSPRTVHLSFLACTGASLGAGLTAPFTSAPTGFKDVIRPPQLDQLQGQIAAAGRKPDLVFMSAGGNDLGFSSLLMECLGLVPKPRVCPGGDASAELAERTRRVTGPAGLYALAASRLAAMGIPADRVFLLAYPNALEGRMRNLTGWGDLEIRSDCVTPLVPGGKDPWTWASDHVVKPLQALQRDVVKTHGWQLIDGHLDDFERHSYCPRNSLAGGDSWWVGILNMVVRQWGFTGAFHPNQRGHRAVADAVKERAARLVSARDDQCRSDPDCGELAYCDKGWLTIGKNFCETFKGHGDPCSRDEQCQPPGTCKGEPAGKCIIEASVGLGSPCLKDAECTTQSCNKDGRCQCRGDADCGRDAYCDTGTVGIGRNACKALKTRGAVCSADKQCGPGLDCKGVIGFKTCK
jgi:lysophospholipase L1-like esterase